MKRPYSLVFIASIIIFFAFSSVFAQQSSVGSGGIGGRPAYPKEDNDRTKSIFIHTINPGESAQDGVKLINNSDTQKIIEVYATDSVRSSDGAFACAQKIEPNNEVGSWITLTKEQVTLDPSKSEVVNFNINVPTNVDVGEHNGCIVIQEQAEGGAVENGIGLSFRSAIRIAILIPGEIIKELAIENLVISDNGDKIILTPTASNSGNVSLDADINTKIEKLWDGVVSESGGQFPVLRDQTASWNFEHERPFWGGWYETVVLASYDSNNSSFIGDQNFETKELFYRGGVVFIRPSLPAIAIYGALILLSVAGGILLIRHRRSNDYVKNNWVVYTADKDDDIKKLASKHKTSWKKIAKVNKIKAPYTIKEGQKIKLPKKDD